MREGPGVTGSSPPPTVRELYTPSWPIRPAPADYSMTACADSSAYGFSGGRRLPESAFATRFHERGFRRSASRSIFRIRPADAHESALRNDCDVWEIGGSRIEFSGCLTVFRSWFIVRLTSTAAWDGSAWRPVRPSISAVLGREPSTKLGRRTPSTRRGDCSVAKPTNRKSEPVT